MLIYVLAGSIAPTLVISKLAPLAQLDRVAQVLVFYEGPVIALPKCQFSYVGKRGQRSKHPMNSIRRTISNFVMLLRESLSRRPDLIYGIYPVPYGWIAVLVAKLVRRPVIVQVIGGPSQIDTDYPLKSLWAKMNLWVFRQCDRVATKGGQTFRYLVERGIDPARLVVLTGSVDIDAFQVRENAKRDIDILFVGRMAWYKGADRVVQVVSELRAKRPSIRAVLLGDGDFRPRIGTMLAERGLNTNVTLPGQVNDVASYCQRAKLFLLPSLTEGLSTAMMEAMTAGVVPIIPNVGDLTDGVAHGVNGMVVERYDDISRFVEYTDMLLTDEERWRELSQQAANFARNNWSVAAESARWQDLLNSLAYMS